jgi:hypothetical protein
VGGHPIEGRQNSSEAFLEVEHAIRQAAAEIRSAKVARAVTRVEDQQAFQSDLLNVLSLVLPAILPEASRAHLWNLHRRQTTGYVGRRSLRQELRYLCQLRLVARRPGRSIGNIKENEVLDLADWVELTRTGEYWINRLEEVEKIERETQEEE